MLAINIDGLEDNFKPAIENSIKNLESAQSILSSIKIPADSTKERIKTLSQYLLNINDRLIEIKKWVEERIVSLNNLENSNKNLLNDIGDLFGLLGLNTFQASDIADSLTSRENAFEFFSDIGSMLFTEAKYDLTNAIKFETDYLKMLGKEIIESEFGEYILIPAYENYILPAYENIVAPVIDEMEKTGATVVVGGTSILSGFLNYFEGTFTNEAGSNEISSKLNNWLYEDTGFGKAINDKSYLKYDSEEAILIQSGVETGCAALSNFFISIGEGIFSFLESLADVAVIAVAFNMTPYVAIGGGMLGFIGGGVEGAIESWDNGEFKDFATGCKEVGSSVINLLVEADEGGLEAVRDSSELKDILTGCKTAGSSVINIGADILGTGSERGLELGIGATKALWSSTKTVVATDCAAFLFKQEEGDYLFDTLKEGIYNTTRAIGKDIGKVASTIVLTIATFGVGGVAVAGGEVTASAAASATSATNFATVAAISGFGEGTQNSWAEGASTLEGLTYGLGNGLWEGFQWFIGGKINNLNLVKNAGGKLTNKIANSTIRIGLDAADGGVEAFVQPGLSAIYKDGYYDENGNYVEFSEDATIADRYKELFDDNGGWTSFWTNAAVGGFMSLIGEAFDLGKFLKDSNNKADIDVDSNKVVFEDTGKINNIDETIIKNNDYKDSNNKADIDVDSNKVAFEDTGKINNIDETIIKNNDYKDFNTNKSDKAEINKEISEYFGDPGEDIANMISKKVNLPDGSFVLEVKTADEVLNSLNGRKKVKFEEFLNNTPQGQYYAKLTADEIKAIRMYTYKGDKGINSALRTGTADKASIETIEKACNMKFEDVVNSLDSAIKKYGGLNENMVIYRGVNKKAILNMAGIEEEYWTNISDFDMDNQWDYLYASLKALEGTDKLLVDDAFMSTSLSKEMGLVKYNEIILKIQAAEGTTGAYIDLFSQFRGDLSENEFLLGANQQLKIISVERQVIEGQEKIIVNCSIE